MSGLHRHKHVFKGFMHGHDSTIQWWFATKMRGRRQTEKGPEWDCQSARYRPQGLQSRSDWLRWYPTGLHWRRRGEGLCGGEEEWYVLGRRVVRVGRESGVCREGEWRVCREGEWRVCREGEWCFIPSMLHKVCRYLQRPLSNPMACGRLFCKWL